MKSTYAYAAAALALTFGLAACIPSSPPPAPTLEPAPIETSTPSPVATQVPAPPPNIRADWLDQPQTSGDWSYGADPDVTIAHFAQSGTEVTASFVIICELGSREITIGRRGNADARSMIIAAETSERRLNLRRMPRTRDLVATTLPANDPLFDAMALTRGRFAVSASGLPTLYLPAWGEVTRVIEDCR